MLKTVTAWIISQHSIYMAAEGISIGVIMKMKWGRRVLKVGPRRLRQR